MKKEQMVGTKAIGTWKLEHYAKLYGTGKITLGRAAREADVSIWAMMDYVRRYKVTAQYDLDDLQRDVETIYARGR